MLIRDKEKVEDLAILGGVLVFEEALHVGRPNSTNRPNSDTKKAQKKRSSTIFYY